MTFYKNPKALLKKLELIVGEILAGNNNSEMRNTGVAVLDVLLKSSLINRAQHDAICSKYFKNG